MHNHNYAGLSREKTGSQAHRLTGSQLQGRRIGTKMLGCKCDIRINPELREAKISRLVYPRRGFPCFQQEAWVGEGDHGL